MLLLQHPLCRWAGRPSTPNTGGRHWPPLPVPWQGPAARGTSCSGKGSPSNVESLSPFLYTGMTHLLVQQEFAVVQPVYTY